MKRGIVVALATGISTVVIVGSVAFIKTNKIFAKEELNSSDISLELVNKERSSKGLKSLNWNEQLAKAAEAKANDMIANNYFDHTSSSGVKAWHIILESGYNYKTAGENLAIDFNSVDQAFNAWLKSPSHLANIESEKYEDYGLAEKEGKIDGKQVKIFVQLFGTK